MSGLAPPPALTAEAAARARELGVSAEAVQIWDACEVIDLHVETFLWTRLLGYNPLRRHGRGLLGARLYSQSDLPRLIDAGVNGSVWSISTNPLRRRSRRTAVTLNNLAWLRSLLHRPRVGSSSVVRTLADYRLARAHGLHACWLALQGGNAFTTPEDLARVPDRCLSRVTLVHLTRSEIGPSSSSAASGRSGLSRRGHRIVEVLDSLDVLVDLAHIGERAFWEAVQAHDRSRPLIVSHTGVRAVHDMWRNLDDDQLKAVADTGGVVGVLLHGYYLDGRVLGGRAAAAVDHLEHMISVIGDTHVALGTDMDGFICTPRDLPTARELPVLVQLMLDRGFDAERIARVLGQNYLRVVGEVRPGSPADASSWLGLPSGGSPAPVRAG